MKPMRKIEPLEVGGKLYDGIVATKLNEVISALNSLMKEPTIKKGDAMWWINSCGGIDSGQWDGDTYDAQRTVFGNVFTSWAAATEARDKVRALLLSLRG